MCKKIVDAGVEHVVMLMADKGTVYLNKNTILQASIPKGIVKNSVCSGDSLVAGFIAHT
ncbi:PfkB family carbohydrate kinase [Caldifermentibacillus hisashii]|uniref:PfkB family carbohydrate kinase n=1 Tax=Caldifermentibacillus hisashii TaxID=996558 RepID=UPI0022871965|nr:PfkB family carbohydrate kinase [Caldifermentibacillus hisashii]